MGRFMDEREEEDDEMARLMEGMEMEDREDGEVEGVDKLMEGMKVEGGGRVNDAITRKRKEKNTVETPEEIGGITLGMIGEEEVTSPNCAGIE